MRGGGGSGIGDRQIQSECAADTRRTAQLDFPAQKARQFAADCEAQPGSAVLAAGASIGLLECLENDFLFLDRNSDASVGDLESDDGLRLAENRVCRGPADGRGRDLE